MGLNELMLMLVLYFTYDTFKLYVMNNKHKLANMTDEKVLKLLRYYRYFSIVFFLGSFLVIGLKAVDQLFRIISYIANDSTNLESQISIVFLVIIFFLYKCHQLVWNLIIERYKLIDTHDKKRCYIL